MFFKGELEQGIDTAINEEKVLLCFVVRDADAESQKWEQELFGEQDNAASSSLGHMMRDKAVILRLVEGTTEAGLLNAFCSINRVPKLVAINNGQVVLDVDVDTAEGVRIEAVKNLVKHATGLTYVPPSMPHARWLPGAGTITPTTTATSSTALSKPVASAKDSPSPAAEENKGGTLSSTDDNEVNAPAWKRSWIEQQRARQREVKVERAAVLKQIEDDKARRKAIAQDRQAHAATPAEDNAVTQRTASTRTESPTCSLQIRLFDGSSIRSKFDAGATLATAVRAYVNEHAGEEIPYNFRLIDLPRPTRTIEISEEGQTLKELGLCPTATLVLVPVKDYTDAYATSGMNGVIRKGFNLGSNVAYGVLGLVGGAITKVTGYGGGEVAEGPYIAGVGDDPSQQAGQPSDTSGSKPPIKITTLADQRKRDGAAEFYNGNQLDVVPRRDDDRQP